MANNGKGWYNDKERHSIVSSGAKTRKSADFFGYIPGFYKSEHQDYYKKRGQKRFLKPEKAKIRSKNYRIATRSGKVTYDEDTGEYIVKPSNETYKAKYSPLGINYKPGERKNICRRKSCYEEYMYIGDDKIVKEEDMLRGISTLDEFEQTLKALESDYKNGVIDSTQFKWRIYLYHMALLSMKNDNPLHGEFSKYKNRVKAQKMLKQALTENGFTQKNWKVKSNYYKSMRKVVPGRGIDTSTQVSDDKIIYLDKNGKETSKESASFYIYKSPKTAGDYMHNRKVTQIIEELKRQKPVRIKKKSGKKKTRAGKKKSSITDKLNIFGSSGVGATSDKTESTLQHELHILSLTSPNLLDARVKNEIKKSLTDMNPQNGKERLHALYKAIFTSSIIPDNLKTRYIQMINDEIIAKGWNRNEIIY